MARRAKIEEVEPEAQDDGGNVITADELLAAIQEINEHKKAAGEASGLAGKATQAAVQKFGCEKNALTFVARMAAMEETKRTSVITSLLTFVITAGWLDEMDMFLRQQMLDLVNRTDNGPAVAA